MRLRSSAGSLVKWLILGFCGSRCLPSMSVALYLQTLAGSGGLMAMVLGGAGDVGGEGIMVSS